MSQERDLNPRPFPYEGTALPAELSWLNGAEDGNRTRAPSLGS